MRRVPASLAERLAAVPGVQRVVPDRWFTTTLATEPGGSSVGRGWRGAGLTGVHLIAGAPPAGAGKVVLDAGVARATRAAVGTSLEVRTPAGIRSVKVTGTAEAAGSEVDLFFTDAAPAELSGVPDSVDALGLFRRSAP